MPSINYFLLRKKLKVFIYFGLDKYIATFRLYLFIGYFEFDVNIYLHYLSFFLLTVIFKKMGRSKTIPVAVRKIIIQRYEDGGKQVDIAKSLYLHKSIVSRIIARFKKPSKLHLQKILAVSEKPVNIQIVT